MLSLFPRDVLNEIWDLIESVSEGFSTYFHKYFQYFDYAQYVTIMSAVYVNVVFNGLR